MANDARLIAPATARNREPIASVLRRHLPQSGLGLEIASGSGEHIVHFATTQSDDLRFQPSDPDAGARASIDAWVELSGVTNVLPAVALDAATEPWPLRRADAVVCINTSPPLANARRELVEAMRAIASSGMAPVNQIPSVGCSIKWKAA